MADIEINFSERFLNALSSIGGIFTGGGIGNGSENTGSGDDRGNGGGDKDPDDVNDLFPPMLLVETTDNTAWLEQTDFNPKNENSQWHKNNSRSIDIGTLIACVPLRYNANKKPVAWKGSMDGKGGQLAWRAVAVVLPDGSFQIVWGERPKMFVRSQRFSSVVRYTYFFPNT